jgi:hypothetical protein
MRKRLEKTVWAPVDDLGIELRLRYLPRSELTRMVERATEAVFDRRTGQTAERVNPEKLVQEYAAAILDWRGLTREVYARLIPIDLEDYPETIPCTDEYKLELLREAYGFDAVVRQICTDLSRFQDEQVEAEVKN